jgi:hypothetical protein
MLRRTPLRSNKECVLGEGLVHLSWVIAAMLCGSTESCRTVYLPAIDAARPINSIIWGGKDQRLRALSTLG